MYANAKMRPVETVSIRGGWGITKENVGGGEFKFNIFVTF
jgi:hypothetical protein